MPPKRKAENELSLNPYTVKSRRRLDGRNDDEIRIEKAKSSDQAAITYRMGKLRQTNEWKQASEVERGILTRHTKDAVIHKR